MDALRSYGERQTDTQQTGSPIFRGLRAGKMFLVAGGSGSGLPGVVDPPPAKPRLQGPLALRLCVGTRQEDAFFTGQQSEPRQAERKNTQR